MTGIDTTVEQQQLTRSMPWRSQVQFLPVEIAGVDWKGCRAHGIQLENLPVSPA